MFTLGKHVFTSFILKDYTNINRSAKYLDLDGEIFVLKYLVAEQFLRIAVARQGLALGLFPVKLENTGSMHGPRAD